MQSDAEKYKKIIETYHVSEKQFEQILEKIIETITFGKIPAEKGKQKMYLIGGQPGAGKTRLRKRIINEIEHNYYGERIGEGTDFSEHSVLVNLDTLKLTHPYFKDIQDNYPESAHGILHSYTEEMKNGIVDALIQGNYNIVYEGALTTIDGYIDLLNRFKNGKYSVEMDIIAVPYLESLSSTYTRYAMALQEEETPRWVEKERHDKSYDGIITTTRELFRKGILDEDDSIRVFTRIPESLPEEIYSSDTLDVEEALHAVEIGREKKRREAVKNYPRSHEVVLLILKDLQPELIPQLKGWEDTYKSEVEYFEKLTNNIDSTSPTDSSNPTSSTDSSGLSSNKPGQSQVSGEER